MRSFREENRFLIYLVNFSGLYLKSVEKLTDRKWLLLFLTLWTKIAIIFIPIYIGSVLKFLICDEGSFDLKMAVFRRLIAFSSFFFKNVFFYIHREKIEGLIDLWDSSFQHDFYSKDREEKLMRNKKLNKRILSLSWMLTLTASLIYSVPPFFSTKKKLSHPSGIPYREQSPDYELMAVFDLFRVVMGCISAVSLDCILIVFLSLVRVQLAHLKDSLTDIVDEISLDTEGGVVYRTGAKRIQKGPYRMEGFEETKREEIILGISTKDSEYKEAIEEFKGKMRIWILHHQQTIKFFETIKSLFTPVASLQLVYVVFYTCFTAFHLVRVKVGIDVFVIPFVASSNLISLFIWCYIGDQLDALSSGLFSDAFNRAWFLFSRKIQKDFNFIMMRGRKPLKLRGISLFNINLFTFFQVFKITYQLFAFMMQVSGDD